MSRIINILQTKDSYCMLQYPTNAAICNKSACEYEEDNGIFVAAGNPEKKKARG